MEVEKRWWWAVKQSSYPCRGVDLWAVCLWLLFRPSRHVIILYLRRLLPPHCISLSHTLSVFSVGFHQPFSVLLYHILPLFHSHNCFVPKTLWAAYRVSIFTSVISHINHFTSFFFFSTVFKTNEQTEMFLKTQLEINSSWSLSSKQSWKWQTLSLVSV